MPRLFHLFFVRVAGEDLLDPLGVTVLGESADDGDHDHGKRHGANAHLGGLCRGGREAACAE